MNAPSHSRDLFEKGSSPPTQKAVGCGTKLFRQFIAGAAILESALKANNMAEMSLVCVTANIHRIIRNGHCKPRREDVRVRHQNQRKTRPKGQRMRWRRYRVQIIKKTWLVLNIILVTMARYGGSVLGSGMSLGVPGAMPPRRPTASDAVMHTQKQKLKT